MLDLIIMRTIVDQEVRVADAAVRQAEAIEAEAAGLVSIEAAMWRMDDERTGTMYPSPVPPRYRAALDTWLEAGRAVTRAEAAARVACATANVVWGFRL